MNQEFSVYPVTDEGLKRMSEVAVRFDDLLNFIRLHCQSYYAQKAACELEMICMMVRKGIAVNHESQLVEK